jgi:heterodisulfide reductase subunit C
LPRVVNVDRNDMTVAGEVLRGVPELEACLGCGGCTATCTAGGHTEFNFRRVQTLVRRGEYGGAHMEMGRCMLCGKCRMVCPRGIDTRAVVMMVKRKLGGY